jgi:hypothetical protein
VQAIVKKMLSNKKQNACRLTEIHQPHNSKRKKKATAALLACHIETLQW